MRRRTNRKAALYSREPLDEATIIHAALDYAYEYFVHHGRWKLPTQFSGPVHEYPGQTWSGWAGALFQGHRGLSPPGRGLGEFYRNYGLKIGYKENVPLLERAYTQWRASGHHGLMPHFDYALTEDLILGAALDHAARHYQATGSWRLPSAIAGTVITHPSQTWALWNVCLRKGWRGLKHKRRGLNEIYQLYGLKLGRQELPGVIEPAWRRWRTNGRHGLQAKKQAS